MHEEFCGPKEVMKDFSQTQSLRIDVTGLLKLFRQFLKQNGVQVTGLPNLEVTQSVSGSTARAQRMNSVIGSNRPMERFLNRQMTPASGGTLELGGPHELRASFGGVTALGRIELPTLQISGSSESALQHHHDRIGASGQVTHAMQESTSPPNRIEPMGPGRWTMRTEPNRLPAPGSTEELPPPSGYIESIGPGRWYSRGVDLVAPSETTPETLPPPTPHIEPMGPGRWPGTRVERPTPPETTETLPPPTPYIEPMGPGRWPRTRPARMGPGRWPADER